MSASASPVRSTPSPFPTARHKFRPGSDSYTRSLEHLARGPSKTLSHSYTLESGRVGVPAAEEVKTGTAEGVREDDSRPVRPGREIEMHDAVRRSMNLKPIAVFVGQGSTPEEHYVDEDDDGTFTVAVAGPPRRISFASEATFYCSSPCSSTSSLASEREALETRTPVLDQHPSLPQAELSSDETLDAQSHEPTEHDSPTSVTPPSTGGLSFKKIFRRSSLAQAETLSPASTLPKRSGSDSSLTEAAKVNSGGYHLFKVPALFRHSDAAPPPSLNAPSLSQAPVAVVRPEGPSACPPAAPQRTSTRPHPSRPPVKIVTEADVAAKSRALEEEQGDDEAMKTAEICFLL